METALKNRSRSSLIYGRGWTSAALTVVGSVDVLLMVM